jgi:DNA modification methylase
MKMNRIINADALEALRELTAGEVDCCICSPPYLGLRDYGAAGQIGLEKTPEGYISRLVQVFAEVKRVLRDDGTLWIVIGDSYAGSGKGGNPDMYAPNAVSRYRTKGIPTPKCKGIKPKDLFGIPWMLAFALRSDGWYLRQDIIWSKPNPMPESVRDRCTKSHEYIFLLSKSRNYYFDASAIAEPCTDSTLKRIKQNTAAQAGSYRPVGRDKPMKAAAPRYGGNKYTASPDIFCRTKSGNAYKYRPSCNKRSVWSVSTQPFKVAHFATFPPELIRPCILAASRPGGVVLDPFFGSGTTGLVAAQHCREYIGIEINPEYVKIAQKRLLDVQQRMF